MRRNEDPLGYYPEIEYRNDIIRKLYLVMLLFGILMLIIVLTLSAGCITASKDLYREITAPPPTPEPTQEPVIITTLTPEPTPPMIIARYGDAMPLGYFVSWRKDNVSGYKDITMHSTIYGYRIFESVNWWSVSWGQYYTQTAPPGYKYLFVFAHTYSDEGSARTWGIQDRQFKVIIGDKTYEKTDDLLPQIRLKEFDEIWDMNHVSNLKPYGYLRVNDNGHEVTEELGFLKAGKSNAWDGYIVYTIPEDTKQKDIKVRASLTNIISAEWKLSD